MTNFIYITISTNFIWIFNCRKFLTCSNQHQSFHLFELKHSFDFKSLFNTSLQIYPFICKTSFIQIETFTLNHHVNIFTINLFNHICCTFDRVHHSESLEVLILIHLRAPFSTKFKNAKDGHTWKCLQIQTLRQWIFLYTHIQKIHPNKSAFIKLGNTQKIKSNVGAKIYEPSLLWIYLQINHQHID